MKKAFLVLVMTAVFAGFSSPALAQSGIAGDLFLSVATEPEDNLGETVGGGIGASAPLTLLIPPMKMGGHEEKVMLRTDVSYYKWSEDWVQAGIATDISYRRIPVFLGARYFHALTDRLRVFGESGLEVSFDRVEVDTLTPNPLFGIFPGEPANFYTSTSESDVNVGLDFGAGVEFSFGPGFFVGGNLRLHAITDSYASLASFIGKRF